LAEWIGKSGDLRFRASLFAGLSEVADRSLARPDCNCNPIKTRAHEGHHGTGQASGLAIKGGVKKEESVLCGGLSLHASRAGSGLVAKTANDRD